MNEFVERKVRFRWAEPRSSYDVVIVGGGGHGLATAYYLATRHGITNVAVLERGYIGGGNSGRNTTVIRSNYGIPEAVRFYQRSIELYEGLEDETDRFLMHQKKGLLWIAHTEMGARAERARAEVNTAFGAQTEYVEPAQIKEICPQIDLNGNGRWPVVGASYHGGGATARHDRVVWALAEGAMARGAHVHQRTAVTGLIKEGERVVGVETNRGDIGAGLVLSATGGWVTRLAEMAGLRLPIRSHPLQALRHQSLCPRVSVPAVVGGPLVLRLADCTRRDAHGGRARSTTQLLDPRRARFHPVVCPSRDHAAAVPTRSAGPAPMDGHLRHEPRLFTDHGRHWRRRFPGHHRLGHVGVQGYSSWRRADGATDRYR